MLVTFKLFIVRKFPKTRLQLNIVIVQKYRSGHQRCSVIEAVLKNFAIFTGKLSANDYF